MKFFKSKDYYLLIDQEKLIVSFSKNTSSVWKELFLKELTGDQCLAQFIPAEFISDFSKLIQNCIKQEHLVFERMFSFPNGKTYNLQLTLNPVVLNDKVPYILICIHNHNNIRTPVEQQHSALSRHVSLTSNKLRAPLNTILNLSHSINESKDPDHELTHIKKLLRNIRSQAESLDTIIHALNDLIAKENRDSQGVPEPSSKKLDHIMLVDDDAIMNMINQRILGNLMENARIVSFTKPAAAITYLTGELPDLIILDINMPVMNGWQFLEALETKKIKVDIIILSSSINPEERNKAFTYSNVKHYLTKPLDKNHIDLLLKDWNKSSALREMN